MSESIVALLPAAGSSRRFGSNKLLHPLSDGTPIAIQCADNLAAVVRDILFVVRPDDHEFKQCLTRHGYHYIENPQYQDGMSSSIVRGISASSQAYAWLIALADMPFIPIKVIEAVVRELNNSADMVVPVFRGQNGHPVGFSHKYYNDLLQLKGDRGARDILNKYPQRLTRFEVDAREVLWDIDEQKDLNSKEYELLTKR